MAAREFARVAPLRAKLALVFVVVLAAALAGRLVNVQLVQGPWLKRIALAQHDFTVETFAKRGSILDRGGGVLVRSLPSESIFAVPPDVTEPHKAALRLAPLLRKSAPDIELALRDTLQFRWLARKVSHDVAVHVRALKLNGIGTKAEETGRRFVPSGRLASTVVGFTGTDEKGLSGLESGFDKVLKGESGRTSIEADQFHRAIPFGQTHVVKPAVAGRTIVTTLDPYVQFQTERSLRAAVQKWHAVSGTALVMDPWTGELLAIANVPDFEPARFGAFSPDSWRDRAVEDAYEPGSTFKLITVAAALESGRIGVGTRFAARDVLHVGGQTIHNAEDGFLAGSGGSESMEDIVAFSHNVGAAEIGMAVGKPSLYRTIRKFGFGEVTQIELPGENSGIVQKPDDWSGSTLATVSFGHGVSTTPIGLARAYAAIANGGMLLRPHVVRALQDANGNTVMRTRMQLERRAISAHTAATLRRYLTAAVVRGTGNPTAHVPGYTVAGKTGTAQVVENGHYASGAYIASFVGMIPAEQPRYVILVKVERPRGAIYGSVVAAPVFAEIARAAMLHANIMPSYRHAPSKPHAKTHAQPHVTPHTPPHLTRATHSDVTLSLSKGEPSRLVRDARAAKVSR